MSQSRELPSLARYRLIRPLARGGLGDVHLAAAADRRPVVVKVARRDQRDAAACLEREAAALARLGPPWTPRLLDRTATTGGDPALVLEHIDWPELRHVLAGRALAVPEAMALGGVLIAAVAAVHRAGIAHGDLSPANVLCRADRARPGAEPPERLPELRLPELRLIDVGATATGEGPALGTVAYAAPELHEPGATAGALSDVYSLGAMLHELVAGEPPFAGSAAELRQAHRTRRPPPVSRRPGVPVELDAVLARAMAKRPADRFADAGELARAWRAAWAEGHARSAGESARDRAARPEEGGASALLAMARRLEEELHAIPAPAVSALPQPPLVGRDADLEALVASAQSALAAGQGAIVTVTAPPGLGKSRLAAELAHRLRAAGAPVRSIRAVVDQPLAPAALALVESAGPDARLAEILAPVDPVAAAALIAAAGGPTSGLAGPLRAAPGALRQAAARGLADAIAGRAPTCILLDDAHAADPLLLDALELATMSERGAPIWVCLLGRPALLRSRPHLGARAGRHERRELAALPPESARALCRRLLDDVEALPALALERLADRAGGVPLLLCELIGAVRRDRLRVRPRRGTTLETDRLTAPADAAITAWAAQRELEAQPAELAAFARLIAVVGDVRLELLVAVIEELEAAGGRVTSWDPGAAVSRLLAAGILVERDGRLDFRHALLGEAIAAQVAPADARAIHAAASRALPAAPVARARHASAAGLHAAAAAAWLEIAAAAAARHAYLDGEEALSRALDHLPADDARRAAALRGRGLARSRLGRHDDAMADLAAARELGGVDLVADILLDEATMLDWAGDFAAAGARVQLARERSRAPDLLRAARLAMAEGRSRWRDGESAAAVSPLDRAVSLAARCGEEGYETWVASLAMLGFLLPATGDLDQAEACLAEALAGAEARCDELHRAAVLNNRYPLWSARGDAVRLAADLAAFTRIGRRLGMPASEYRGELNEAVLALWLARDDDAARHAGRARAFEERMPELFPGPGAALLLAQIAARAGRRDEAATWLAASQARPIDSDDDSVMVDAIARWLAGQLEPAPWIEAAGRAAAAGAPETGCELLDLLAIELSRRGQAGEARRLRLCAAALPGVPGFLAARLRGPAK